MKNLNVWNMDVFLREWDEFNKSTNFYVAEGSFQVVIEFAMNYIVAQSSYIEYI